MTSRYGITTTVAPTAEPVTLAEAKQHMRVEVTADDALIRDQIRSAREYFEERCDRTLMTSTRLLTLDYFPCEIVLPRGPAQSVSSIQYLDAAGDTQTLDSSLYRVASKGDPCRIMPAYGHVWPVTRCVAEAVSVTYVAGFASAASVPQRFKQAILLLVAQMYEFREPSVTGNVVNKLDHALDSLLSMGSSGWMY